MTLTDELTIMTETWNIFSQSDIIVAILGALGLASVVIVFSTASSNVNKREVDIRSAIDARRKMELEETESEPLEVNND